ncbi:MAG: O-acetylhomoserine aminocarboxypropyltransferase [Gammaproteobacteria bacterium]|nr:O-acetylhomoserine aminocarboxypropyltransferase [Gammaproteobacteria bacterium]
MSRPVKTRFDTLALHAGQRPDPLTGARAAPIYQTASYVFQDSDHAAALFNMERPGHAYSRLSNPTCAVLEERVAALEDGVGGLATASGQAALHLAVATLMGAGAHIVSSAAIYGGSHNLLQYTLPRFGIDATFVPPRDLDGIAAAIRPNTKLIFGEVVGNPGGDVLDVPAVAELAHAHGIPLLIDSTFTTPHLFQPFHHGADLIMHSATKFLCGHGTVIGGVLVERGQFDWKASGRFDTLAEPYSGFHGMTFDEESSQGAFLLRARREGLRDFGACMSPTTAFYILQGLETLSIRMQRHQENTRKVVEFLRASEAVEDISYPELEEHPDHQLAQKLLPKGAGAVFCFTLRGGREAGRAFTEGLEIFSHLANVGDAKSLVIHPASTTHYRMSDADLAAAGINQGTIRLSIGLEDADDLLEDLSRGIHLAKKVAG